MDERNLFLPFIPEIFLLTQRNRSAPFLLCSYTLPRLSVSECIVKFLHMKPPGLACSHTSELFIPYMSSRPLWSVGSLVRWRFSGDYWRKF